MGFSDSDYIITQTKQVDLPETETETALASIITSAVSFIAIILVISLFIAFKKNRLTSFPPSLATLKNLKPRENLNTEVSHDISGDILLDHFHSFYQEAVNNDHEKLREEYKSIQRFEIDLKLPSNVAKAYGILNRYVNITPYDFNRVILDDDEFQDEYINASYIKVSLNYLVSLMKLYQ